MPKEIIIAAAGGGKTTRIVRRAINDSRRSALVTYTSNNVQELRSRLYEASAAIPGRIEVWSWFRFLLHELVRPYQAVVVPRRVDGLCFVDGRSAPYVPKTNIHKYYLANNACAVYSDKISELVIKINHMTHGAVIDRLTQRFASLFIDEIQDMSGWDLEILDILLRSKIDVVLIGDHRQATFRTNMSPKNKKFAGIKIIGKCREWERSGIVKLHFETETFRCNQQIANFADGLFPNEPATISANTLQTGHDGVFIIDPALTQRYIETLSPQILRLDKKTGCAGYAAMNFGDSKGLTFDRVLIFPHKKCQQWLRTGNGAFIDGSRAKLYVGVTRARHSVAFVLDGPCALKGVTHLNDI